MTSFDEAAASWVGKKFAATPITGSVEFDVDFMAYDSGPRYCDIEITWRENRPSGPVRRINGETVYPTELREIPQVRSISISDFDLTQLIREITEIALEGVRDD